MIQDNEKSLVVVTGATGFVAGWLISELLSEGYRVRGTVRSLKNEDKIAHLISAGKANGNRLELVEADLMDEPQKWQTVIEGATYVCHTASPFPLESPKDEQILIKPAVQGTLNALRAVAEVTSVKRIVITSSVVSIISGWGIEGSKKLFSEEDWAKEEKSQAYAKSKLFAERAAWDFAKNLPSERNLEVVTVNPSYVLGPLLAPTGGDSSRTLIMRLLTNDMPGLPALHLNVVDVRDVARAHVLAMTHPEAAGNRFICSSEGFWMAEIAKILDKEFSPKGYKITSTNIPKALVWLVSFWDGDAAAILSNLGLELLVTNEKIKKLGLEFRSGQESIIAMANSMINMGLIKNK